MTTEVRPGVLYLRHEPEEECRKDDWHEADRCPLEKAGRVFWWRKVFEDGFLVVGEADNHLQASNNLEEWRR